MSDERVPWITNAKEVTPPDINKVVEREEASIEAAQEKIPKIRGAE